MAIKIQVQPQVKLSAHDKVISSGPFKKIIFSFLGEGYIGQDRTKAISKLYLKAVTHLQRDDLKRDFPAEHVALIGGDLDKLKELPIRNFPMAIPPPKKYRLPQLALGWTMIRPKEAGEKIRWQLHVWRQLCSTDGTALHKMAIYFSDEPKAEARIGLWEIDGPCCTRYLRYPCCDERFKFWDCWFQIGFFCGWTKKLEPIHEYEDFAPDVTTENVGGQMCFKYDPLQLYYQPIFLLGQKRRKPSLAKIVHR